MAENKRPESIATLVTLRSEPKHNSGGEPEMVLPGPKKMGVNFVALHSPGKAFDQLVIEPSADGCGKGRVGVRNVVSGIGDVAASNQGMRKRREFSNRDRDSRSEQNR